MKGIVYEIMVSEGVMDWVHGGEHPIKEVYIPEYNISINGEGHSNVFTTYKGRYDGSSVKKIREIEIPNEQALWFRDFVKAQESADIRMKEVVKSLMELA